MRYCSKNMTRAQQCHLFDWTCQAMQLWLVVLLIPFTSSMTDPQICLRTQDTCSCSGPPPPPPTCLQFCKASIECPDDIIVCDTVVSYTYSVTHYPSGIMVNYTVPSDPGGTVATDSVGQESCFQYDNSSCSHSSGFQYPMGTTEVTCQAYDCCHRLTECSFNINVECNNTEFEICNTVQTFFIVLLALNTIGWICCLVAALVPSASPSTRSTRNKGSRANDRDQGGTLSTNCPEDHDDYVNSLFQDIDQTGTSIDETSDTGSKTTTHE